MINAAGLHLPSGSLQPPDVRAMRSPRPWSLHGDTQSFSISVRRSGTGCEVGQAARLGAAIAFVVLAEQRLGVEFGGCAPNGDVPGSSRCAAAEPSFRWCQPAKPTPDRCKSNFSRFARSKVGSGSPVHTQLQNGEGGGVPCESTPQLAMRREEAFNGTRITCAHSIANMPMNMRGRKQNPCGGRGQGKGWV